MKKLLVLLGMACLIAAISCAKKKSTEPEDQLFTSENSLGLLRGYWTKGSPPQGKTDATRDRLIWYNPYQDFFYSDVYDRDSHPQNLRLKVMVLRLTPDSSSSWGAVIRAIPSFDHDQTDAQYLDARIGTYGDVPGVLHLELGEISEDVDHDGVLDSEDREIRDENGFLLRPKNGIIDDGEDTGLDSLFSHDEPGYDPDTNRDPSGDDWYYDAENPENYEGINGTEGNAGTDYYGERPDTEDNNGDDFLDIRNRYYSFSIDLLNSPFLVEGSEYTAERISSDLVFRSYRVPLWGQSNDPLFGTGGDSTMILFARLWLDGMTQQTMIIIGGLDLVPKPG